MSKNIDVNVVNEQSQTALHLAAANGRQNAVRLLVTKGASLEFPNWCGWTALMYASYYGHSEIVSYLIENKAQVNVCNSRLVTPLICAARCGKTAVIEILLQNGADIVPKAVEKTPTSQLINKEPNMPTPNKIVWRAPMTALMAAAQHGHHGICSLLMTYNAPIDYQNEANGYTALMLAAVNGHAKIVELLIQTGSADANIVNCRNQTAYVLSILRKRTDVEHYLKSRTTRITKEITAKSQQPPIIQAARTGFLFMQIHAELFMSLSTFAPNIVGKGIWFPCPTIFGARVDNESCSRLPRRLTLYVCMTLTQAHILT